MSSEPLEPNQDVIIPRSRQAGTACLKAQLTRTDNQSEKVALVRQTAPPAGDLHSGDHGNQPAQQGRQEQGLEAAERSLAHG